MSGCVSRFGHGTQSSPTYDTNGNLLTITDGTSHSYSWDAEGKQIGIDSLTATYDALGRMVELNSSGTYTETVYGLGSEKLALMTGQNMQKSFIALPSGTAVYTASGLSYYRHSDWLGSSRFASTTTRTMYSSSAYAPFGEPYAEAGTVDRNFTGQNEDVSNGHYDFLFRRLSYKQGRWISPDPSGLAAVNLADPQSWNRYEYALNDPLDYIDPNGLNICVWHDSINGDTVDMHPDSQEECQNNGGEYVVTDTVVDVVATPDSPVVIVVIYGGPAGDPTISVQFGSADQGGNGQGAANNLPTTKVTKDQCLSDFYNSVPGKVVQFGSPLSLLNSWNPNAAENRQNWAEAIVSKGVGFAPSMPLGQDFSSILAGTTRVISSTFERGASATLHFLEKVATPYTVLSTAADIQAHANCRNLNKDAMEMPD